MDEYRDYPFTFETRDDDPGDGLTLEGYAAVFNSPTTITERGRTFSEVVAPGAFKRSLNVRAPVLMFNHGQHPVIGDLPIGVITHAREDSHGLYIRSRLANNWLTEPVRDAIANESITGMSFRFSAEKDEWDKDQKKRTLREVNCPECGPVVFPAYDATSVNVRSRELAQEILNAAASDDRVDFARALLLEDLALRAEPADDGTSETDQPATDTDQAPPATPSTSRRERLLAVAKLKGITE